MSYLLGVMNGIILPPLERESRFVRLHALQSILNTAIALVTPIVVFLVGLHPISYVLLPAFVSAWFFASYRAGAATTASALSLVGGPSVVPCRQVDHAVSGIETIDRE